MKLKNIKSPGQICKQPVGFSILCQSYPEKAAPGITGTCFGYLTFFYGSTHSLDQCLEAETYSQIWNARVNCSFNKRQLTEHFRGLIICTFRSAKDNYSTKFVRIAEPGFSIEINYCIIKIIFLQYNFNQAGIFSRFIPQDKNFITHRDRDREMIFQK